MTTARCSVVLLAFVVSLRSVSICHAAGDCGNIFVPEAPSGVIQSPNYPFDYRSPASCVYTFLPASGSHVVRICFEFRRFHLDAGPHDQDYLEFLSGYRYCEQGRLCISDKEHPAVPLTVWKENFCWQTTDPGKPLQLTFHARSGSSSSGFFAYYKNWPITELGQHPGCELISPQHHADAPDPDQRCVIRCPDGSQCDLASQPDCSCPGVVPCDRDQFTCFNRKCIPDSLACDRLDNCGDGSDETYMHARCQSRDLLSINFLSCDFELDVCGFLGLSSWKPDSGYYLGPFEDHTVGIGGHYLRTDFTDQKTDTKISFFSQALKSFPVEGLCLSFWYYSADDNRCPNDASGEDDDLLVVRFGKTVIWRTNTPKPAWHSAHAYITREDGLHKSQTKFQFEVTRGRGRITLVALDDIVLYKGQCHQVLEPSCTFEQHSCGWMQNSSEDLGLINETTRWHLHSNSNIGRGRFLYLAINSSISTPDYSSLSIISPYVTSARHSDYCVELRLYTSSESVMMEIRQQTWPHEERTVWSNRYNAAPGWGHVAVTVPGSRVFRIVLSVLSAENGDSIAIDDVSISRGHCYNHSDVIIINSTVGPNITASSSTSSVPHGCSPDERLCHTDNICVKDDKWCDGHTDCPNGEDEHADLCSGHESDPDAAGRRPVSVLTTMVAASVAFLLALILVSLVSFCLLTSLKWRRVPPVTSSAGGLPATAGHVISAADMQCPAASGAHSGIPKSRPASVSGTNHESYMLQPACAPRRIAHSVDSTPYLDPSGLLSIGVSGQSGYLEPPPRYSSAVCLGTAYPDGGTPTEGRNQRESTYTASYVTGSPGDVTPA